MPRQLTLDLTTSPAFARADFLSSPSNEAALAALDEPESWPQGNMLLIGPEGSGKSHMAAFWADENDARLIEAGRLTPEQADSLVAQDGGLVVDNADLTAQSERAEQALFHLWNLCGVRNSRLLMTARTPPRDWGLLLPDLRSRMDSVAQLRLGTPDESLLAAVLVKLFSDRQLRVSVGLIDWLLLRMDRDLGLARRLVAEMDRAALAQKGPVTRSIAAELLDKLTNADA